MSKDKTVEERAEELAKLLEQRVRELKNQSEKLIAHLERQKNSLKTQIASSNGEIEQRGGNLVLQVGDIFDAIEKSKQSSGVEELLMQEDIESLRNPQERGEVLEKFSEQGAEEELASFLKQRASELKIQGEKSVEYLEARKKSLEAQIRGANAAEIGDLEKQVGDIQEQIEERKGPFMLEALLLEDQVKASDLIDEASRLQEVQRILVQDADQELADKIKESHELLRGALEDKGSTVTVQKTEAERLAEAKNQSGNIASSLAEIQDPEFKKTLCKEIAGRVKDKDYGFRLSEAEIIFDKLNKDDKKEFFAALKPENQMEFINSGNSLSDDRKIKLFRRVIKEQNKPETSAVMSPQQILKQAKGQQNNRRQQEEPFEISEQNRGLYVTALMQEVARDRSITNSLGDLYDAREKSSGIQFKERDRAANVIASKLKKTDISGLFSGMDEKQEAAFKKEISESIKQDTKKTVWQRISSAVKNAAVSMGIIKSRPAPSVEKVKKARKAVLEKQSKAIITTAHKAAKQRLSKQESNAKSKVKALEKKDARSI